MVKKNPDKKPASGTTSGNSGVRTRWRIAFFLGVTAAIIGSTLWIIMQVTEVSTTKDLRVPYFVSVQNPSKTNETMLLNIRAESTGGFIAAQHDVTIHGELYPDHQLRGEGGYGYADLPANYTLVFEGTECTGQPHKFSIIGSSTDACMIDLLKKPVKASASYPDGVNYVGDGKIRFVVGGQFGILLATNIDETTGSIDVHSSESKFMNIAAFEVARELELSEKTLYMAIPLAIIGASISLIPLFFRKETG